MQSLFNTTFYIFLPKRAFLTINLLLWLLANHDGSRYLCTIKILKEYLHCYENFLSVTKMHSCIEMYTASIPVAAYENFQGGIGAETKNFKPPWKKGPLPGFLIISNSGHYGVRERRLLTWSFFKWGTFLQISIKGGRPLGFPKGGGRPPNSPHMPPLVHTLHAYTVHTIHFP